MAVSAPVGSLSDKLALLPLILKVKTTSVEKLFREEETDTLDLLTREWFFSDVMLEGACCCVYKQNHSFILQQDRD